MSWIVYSVALLLDLFKFHRVLRTYYHITKGTLALYKIELHVEEVY